VVASEKGGSCGAERVGYFYEVKPGVRVSKRELANTNSKSQGSNKKKEKKRFQSTGLKKVEKKAKNLWKGGKRERGVETSNLGYIQRDKASVTCKQN